jgi:hypothetical protein
MPPSSPRPTRSLRGPLSRLLVLVLLCGLFSARLAAQDDPRFLIEKISLSGHRRPATARIVVAESRLKEGQSYDERELREAIYRIRRLPFVVDADFALRRGSRRGAYELAITIEQTTPIFLSYDLEGLYAVKNSRGDRALHAVDSGSLGVREFVGAQGLAFASVDKDAQFFTAGYTRYDPFGRGSFVSAGVTRDRSGRQVIPTLSLGTPLSGNQSLRADLSWARSEAPRGFDFRLDNRAAALTWIYDTTDDPLFPGRGVKLTGGAFYETIDSRTPSSGFPSQRQLLYGLDATAARYWQLTPRQSLGLSLSGIAERASSSAGTLRFPAADSYAATLGLLHSVSLWSGERTRRFGDLRWETSAEEAAGRSGGVGSTVFTVRTGLAFRSTWAVIHLGTSELSGPRAPR